MIQRVQKVRAQFRFEYVACRKTFRKLGRYTRTYLYTIIHMLIHLFKRSNIYVHVLICMHAYTCIHVLVHTQVW